LKNGVQKLSAKRDLDAVSLMFLGPDFRREDDVFLEFNQQRRPLKNGFQKLSAKRDLYAASLMFLGPDFCREGDVFLEFNQQRRPVEKRGPEVECEA
jgi:hypothetical protein